MWSLRTVLNITQWATAVRQPGLSFMYYRLHHLLLVLSSLGPSHLGAARKQSASILKCMTWKSLRTIFSSPVWIFTSAMTVTLGRQVSDPDPKWKGMMWFYWAQNHNAQFVSLFPLFLWAFCFMMSVFIKELWYLLTLYIVLGTQFRKIGYKWTKRWWTTLCAHTAPGVHIWCLCGDQS